MNARAIIDRALSVRKQMDAVLIDRALVSPLASWRISPKTWTALCADARLGSTDIVDATGKRLLGIPVKLDLGPHPGDLILQLAIEDRQSGGLG